MTTWPPGQVSLLGNNLLLDNRDPLISYVGHDGSIFYISGPMAPILGAQNGIVALTISGLVSPFTHLDNQGARQDGTTWQDAVYDPGEIDMLVESSGLSATESRQVISAWIGAWDAKKQGKLSWFTPERGEWWANVRMSKTFADQFTQSHSRTGRQRFTWTARNDDAFWRSVDSVSSFQFTFQTQTVQVEDLIQFTLTYGGHTTSVIPTGSSPSTVQAALVALPNIAPGDVVVTGNGAPFYTITFPNSGTIGTAATVLTAANAGITTATSGFCPLTNIGDQDGWPRYLCYGPGTFSFGDGPSSTNMITFGPLLENQVVLLTTLPRLRSVVDLSVNQPPAQQLNIFQELIKDLISFATINNVPPLLQQFESFFGILPPQGVLYSLLTGRFTTPIPPMTEGVAPEAAHIPVSIAGGNSNSKVVAALTPYRRWPE